ncbi:MAG: diphthine--ammonia ligase [Proteobacteria bacterium]|nr:diphthine--ammonia ligase [Pseudomonadota bacterium]
MKNKKAFCSWSGGKESAMALYEAQKQSINVEYLLNMAQEDGNHSRTHGLSSELLRAQSKALNIPLLQQRASWETYENEFKKAVSALKNKGITTGVFGDIDMAEHREWVERVCSNIPVEPVLPLWLKGRAELINAFIDAGFKAIVVATDARFLGEEWLGRSIDNAFIDDIKSLKTVDLCGEKGEYHTFVYDGPIFENPVRFTPLEKVLTDSYWFLQLVPGKIK